MIIVGFLKLQYSVDYTKMANEGDSSKDWLFYLPEKFFSHFVDLSI